VKTKSNWQEAIDYSEELPLAERKRVRQAEQDDYLQKLLMMGSPRRYLEEDDDE
jgi:hypothetical protein